MNKFANTSTGIAVILLTLSLSFLICSEALLNYHTARLREAEEKKYRAEMENLQAQTASILKELK